MNWTSPVSARFVRIKRYQSAAPYSNCPRMLLTHLGDPGGRRQLRVVGDKMVQQGYVFAHRLQRSPFPLSLSSSIIQKAEGVGTLRLVDQEARTGRCRSGLTPNFAFLSECPIVLPFFPDPFRTRTSFPDFAIVSFDCGENGGRYLIIVARVAND